METLAQSLYTTKAVIIIDSMGDRVMAKYYGTDFPTLKDQKAFEKTLFDKTKRVSGSSFLLFFSFLAPLRLPPKAARWSCLTAW